MKSIHRLQLAHNAAARVVTKSFKFEHITLLLRNLHWLPILKGVHFKIIVLTFKILHIGYLCELLNWYGMVWYGNVLFDIIEYAMPENRF